MFGPCTTKRIKTAWPIASVYYQPVKMLTVRGDIQEINTGTAYTAISPHTDIGGRFSVRFRPPKSSISKTAEWCATKRCS